MIPIPKTLLVSMLLLFLFLTTVSSLNLTVDIAKLKEYYHHDPKCYFLEAEYTMRTISKWPSNCPYVCGVLTFNENYDVLEEKLNATIGKLEFFFGSIRVINTNFTSLAFLPKFGTTCGPFGSYFLNNSKLENVDFILKSYQYIKESTDCIFHITNNPILDTTSICKNGPFASQIGVNPDFRVSGNLVDCGCNAETLSDSKECSIIIGNLMISNETENQVSSLKKIEKIIGDLEIYNTNLRNLSFFENLLEIRSKSNFSTYRININIHDNPEMTRFGIGSLKKLSNVQHGRFNLNLQNSHVDFCVTVEEMIIFLNSDAKFINIEARYCSIENTNLNSTSKPKFCIFENMASLDPDCAYIYGNVLIDSGDEDYVDKLNKVTYIFGTLTVKNTNLKTVKFLKKLERVANLDSTLPVMQFLDNPSLRNFDFSNLQPLVTWKNNKILVDANHPDLLDRVQDCLKLQFIAQTNVSFNGKPCRNIPNSLQFQFFNETIREMVTRDFDFDTDMDYSEEGRDTWYDLYDGGAVLDTHLMFVVYDITNAWRTGNDVAAAVAFFINMFHLIILLHRELRSSFIYILMIGICLCDLLFAFSFIIEYLLENGWIYDRIDTIRSKFHMTVSQLEAPIQEVTRKSSTLLAFTMALFRTLSVVLPTSGVIMTLSKPRWAVVIIIGVVLVQGSWDTTTYLLCRRKYRADSTGHETYNLANGFYVQCVETEREKNDDDILRFMMKIDGNFTIILAVLYLIITIVLLNQLREARKRRKKTMKSEKSDGNTSLLVTVMAITFFLSELTYGLFFVTESYFRKNYPDLSDMMQQGQVILWSLVTLNSSVHCLICFFLSSQYRSAVKGLFWCIKKRDLQGKRGVVKDLATRTMETTKTAKSGISDKENSI